MNRKNIQQNQQAAVQAIKVIKQLDARWLLRRYLNDNESGDVRREFQRAWLSH